MRHHGHHRSGRLHFRRPFPNRQELVDTEDLIRHLRDNGEQQPAQA
jgi:hypothetical protein